ncbi:uncharacterized protein DDB_G0290587 [Drosophila novamexicana]|uniref:uncharacterized protein DDB_G0290587 n=1 Tax=Drosophila novamexicana TaxID=47314 RepID=UPI0011E5E3CE|nr:uncharacterized protein DDB_G0290587 [Drosophila novamexicana]
MPMLMQVSAGLWLIAGFSALPLPSSGFWWPKATTETPRTQVLQQIPLTYFRTYTYQPLTGGAFGVPLFGFGAAQTPLLSGRHYDPYAVTSYAAARRHDAAAAGFKPDVTPPALASSNSASSTTPAPTTTTTTTTTPAPTTTTTTTTTTSSTTSAPPTSSTTETTSPLRYAAYNAEYPTYNRRVNNLYNARPQYPYPDYFNYQPQNTLPEKGGARIQFVPCMCPVSMPSMSGMSGLGLNGATSTDRDRPTGVSISSTSGDVSSAERNIVALQARHIDSGEADFEEEEDEQEQEEADASAEADEADVAVAVPTKVALEPQHTTPAVESNSVV